MLTTEVLADRIRAEYTALPGTSVDTMKAAAAFAFGDPALEYVFITDGTNGYLFADGGGRPDVMVTLKGINSVDQFSWESIV